jgi:hypothetical protein
MSTTHTPLWYHIILFVLLIMKYLGRVDIEEVYLIK